MSLCELFGIKLCALFGINGRAFAVVNDLISFQAVGDRQWETSSAINMRKFVPRPGNLVTRGGDPLEIGRFREQHFLTRRRIRERCVEQRAGAVQKVTKEVVGIYALLNCSLFGDDIPRTLLRRVSLAESTSAP